MKRQKVLLSVFVYASEQYSLPSVQMAICKAMRGVMTLLGSEPVWPLMRHFIRVKLEMLSHVWSRLITRTPLASYDIMNLA